MYSVLPTGIWILIGIRTRVYLSFEISSIISEETRLPLACSAGGSVVLGFSEGQFSTALDKRPPGF